MIAGRLLVGFLLVAVAVNQTYAGNPSTINWLGFCSESKWNEAKIINFKEVSSDQSGNYCVLLQDQQFEPLLSNYSGDDGNKPIPGNPATMLLVSVDVQELKLTEGRLQVLIEQKIPVCQECESGCGRFKESKEISKSFPLTGNTKRYVINVGELIPSWYLIGIRVKAVVFDGKMVVKESTIEKQGWPWCI